MEATHNSKTTATLRKIEWIYEQIEAGRTVSIATPLQVIRFSAKDVSRWRESGLPIVKAGLGGGCLMVLDGYRNRKARYIDASYCKISAE